MNVSIIIYVWKMIHIFLKSVNEFVAWASSDLTCCTSLSFRRDESSTEFSISFPLSAMFKKAIHNLRIWTSFKVRHSYQQTRSFISRWQLSLLVLACQNKTQLFDVASVDLLDFHWRLGRTNTATPKKKSRFKNRFPSNLSLREFFTFTVVVKSSFCIWRNGNLVESTRLFLFFLIQCHI